MGQASDALHINHGPSFVVDLGELHHGQLIAQGAPRDVVRNKSVIEAYLGAKYAATNPGGRN